MKETSGVFTCHLSGIKYGGYHSNYAQYRLCVPEPTEHSKQQNETLRHFPNPEEYHIHQLFYNLAVRINHNH